MHHTFCVEFFIISYCHFALSSGFVAFCGLNAALCYEDPILRLVKGACWVIIWEITMWRLRPRPELHLLIEECGGCSALCSINLVLLIETGSMGLIIGKIKFEIFDY